jgi:Zn-dependent M28 family amino/carboxypeptidase
MVEELQSTHWDVSVQELPYSDYMIQNVIAKRGTGTPWFILGAHYDTRIFADQDPDPEKRQQPVPGANDGASGVAVLVEMARVLPLDFPGEVWLVFFDAEDNGNIPGWDWILGSRAFVEVLEGQPDAVVIVDMIGDLEQEIYWEISSDQGLSREIWGVAEKLGYGDRFISSPRYRILDDHSPFLWAGIPAVDIIDFDYPAYHTVGDTIDKVSAQSLQAVGDVLYHWLLTKWQIESDP